MVRESGPLKNKTEPLIGKLELCWHMLLLLLLLHRHIHRRCSYNLLYIYFHFVIMSSNANLVLKEFELHCQRNESAILLWHTEVENLNMLSSSLPKEICPAIYLIVL
ncbi:hypothetical protein AAHE18_13G396500 [Arachis hypogaea]